ncbi:hypothetical protein QP176_12170 [Sphingomonas aerolata]
MKRLLLSTMAFASAFAMAPAAHAADFVPGNPEFTVSGDITDGTVSADFGRSGIASGMFTDTFNFIIDQTGLASGTLSTNTTRLTSSTDLDILSVFINGFAATKTIVGNAEFFEINNVAITSGATNKIVVNGMSRGNGSYARAPQPLSLRQFPRLVPGQSCCSVSAASAHRCAFVVARRRSHSPKRISQLVPAPICVKAAVNLSRLAAVFV